MANLIQSYEQQYSVLTAEITSKIGRLKVAGSENADQLSKEIQTNFEEANELLEQLELEARGVLGSSAASGRVAAYKAELQRIRQEYRSVLTSADSFQGDGDDTFEEWTGVNEQKLKLLGNAERLERVGGHLTEGYRVAIETEQIGAAVLRDLSGQRETIDRARGRLRETDAELNRSSRIMNSMIMRSLQERFALWVFLGIGALLLCLGLYFYIT